MKRCLLTLVVAALFALGCSGPKPSDPKATAGKEDPRIKRAGGNSGAAAPQPAAFKKIEGRAAQ